MEGIEMKDSKGNMFIKYSTTDALAVASNKDSGYYPSLSISSDAIPELEGKTAGDECEICIKGKIKSVRIEDHMPTMFDIEIQNAFSDEEDTGEYDKEEAKKGAAMMKYIGGMKKKNT
jgi:hypothetical protein